MTQPDQLPLVPARDLEATINERIGEVRTEALDLSFGEIVSLHNSGELVIAPEYQRLFRWSEEQQSRLVESILLELPIPQLFVVENANGVFELIDGLQRVSSMVHFIEPTSLDLEPLVLEGCDLLDELNGLTFAALPLSLRLRLKRSAIRVIVIKKQSAGRLRFEMFKRLNTGGSLLSPQEIRNVTARILGAKGVQFYQFLQELASSATFQQCTETLSEKDRTQKADEELVLRFFAVKNYRMRFRGSVRDWLDEFMEKVVLDKVAFVIDDERQVFDRVFKVLAEKLGPDAFVRYRGATAMGALAPAYFEAVTMGALGALATLEAAEAPSVRVALSGVVQSADFRDFTGPGANSIGKLEGRIDVVTTTFKGLVA